MSRNAQTAKPDARNHANASGAHSPSLATAMQRTLPAAAATVHAAGSTIHADPPLSLSALPLLGSGRAAPP